MKEKNKSVKINYIKTSNYRTYYIDGAHGGFTPKLKLHMDLFLDRNITPKIIEYTIDDNGIMNNEGKIIDSKEGAAREIECGIVMDIETVKSLHNWLGQKIDEYDQIVLQLEGDKK